MPEFPKRGYLRTDLTDNCNIRCIMCQIYNGLPVNTMQVMDYDQFVSNTRGELHHWQTIQLGNVAEATIHPRFGDFVRYIRAEAPEAVIHIVTNGRLLAKYAPVINDAGNCLVQVSMDSISRETHEYIRAGSKFDRAISDLQLLDPARAQVLLSFTLMASNIDEYPAMVEFCQSRGYKMSAFPMIMRPEGGILPLSLVHESLWFRHAKLDGWLRTQYGARHASMVGAATGAMPPVEDWWCNAHWDDLNVAANGGANLCGKLTLGNLMKRHLRDLWNSPDATAFRAEVELDRGPCMTCDYRQRCLSPSMALMANHFADSIMNALPAETVSRIGYNRSISDEEAMVEFIRGCGDAIGVFDIWEADEMFYARRVTAGHRGVRYAAPISANTRHELHAKMRAEAAPDTDPVLIQENVSGYNIVRYSGFHWALPMSLGQVHLGRESDRKKPGILKARSLAEVVEKCTPLVTISNG